jgi:hypothetical protein
MQPATRHKFLRLATSIVGVLLGIIFSLSTLPAFVFRAGSTAASLLVLVTALYLVFTAVLWKRHLGLRWLTMLAAVISYNYCWSLLP